MSIQRGIVFGALLVTLLPAQTFGAAFAAEAPDTASAPRQTTFATITGIVTDSGGGVVPGVSVEARHVRSNYTYTTTTNESGHYTIGQLREGEYVLRVQLAGFNAFVAQNVQLAAQDLRRIDVRLEVGGIETSIKHR
jgi:hypothetical protein